MRIAIHRLEALAWLRASADRKKEETCAVSVTHPLDGPFDHRRDCAAPPGGVRAPERGRSAGRGRAAEPGGLSKGLWFQFSCPRPGFLSTSTWKSPGYYL